MYQDAKAFVLKSLGQTKQSTMTIGMFYFILYGTEKRGYLQDLLQVLLCF
jgi:hypothetical protein